MAMIKHLVAFLVTIVTVCQVDSAPKPCCFPDQWSGNIVQTIGAYNSDEDVASLAYGSTEVSVDYTGKQMALRERIDNETKQRSVYRWVIYKYSDNKKYVIQNKTCVASNLTDNEKMEPQCMPDDAVFFGTHRYPADIMVDVWFYNDDTVGGQKRVGVTSGCVPITLSQITGGPGYHLNLFLYQNVTTTIPDPTIFQVPADCNQDQLLVETETMDETDNEQNIVYEMEMNEFADIY